MKATTDLSNPHDLLSFTIFEGLAKQYHGQDADDFCTRATATSLHQFVGVFNPGDAKRCLYTPCPSQ